MVGGGTDMLLPCVLFLMTCLQVQSTPTNALVGSWVNQNPSTIVITEIVINKSESGHLQAHVWGKCDPTDCDWGVTEVNSSNGLARSIFDAGFATTTIQFIPLPDERLLVVSKAEYKDQSGYKEPDQAEFFVRENPAAQDSESLAAKALLNKVAETYRSLSAARFESERFVESLGQLSTRQTTFSKIVISQPNNERVETTLRGEPTVIISDGKTLWYFFPGPNEYIAAPAGKLPFAYSGVGYYTRLDKIREPARITGSGRIADTDCTTVMLGRDGNYTHTLWIDPKTNFVRKDESRVTSPNGDGRYYESSVTTFSVARAVDNLDATIFSFDPEKIHAKDRQKLQKDAPVTSIGTLAPDFTLRNLDGKEVHLSDLRGKVVVLDFWATWCPVCRSNMPVIELLHRQFKNKGLVVLGINDEEPGLQSAFLSRFGYSFSSLVDPEKKIGDLYNVGGIPVAVIIDRDGKIRSHVVGDSSYEALWADLHRLGVFREEPTKEKN
jgi:peroxiredoxin/outer membrane lipoprotein-sorting protein